MKNLILASIATGGLLALSGCASDDNTMPSSTTTTTTTEQSTTTSPPSYGGPEGTGNSVQGAGGS